MKEKTYHFKPDDIGVLPLNLLKIQTHNKAKVKKSLRGFGSLLHASNLINYHADVVSAGIGINRDGEHVVIVVTEIPTAKQERG